LSGNYLYANGAGNASIFGGTSWLFDTTSGGSFRFRNGSMALGASVADATAHLDVQSTTKGFLPPRMTTTQRDAIVTPATGLRIYNTTTNTNDTYNGTAWQSNSVSGVAGAIQFSDGSAFASDASNLFWDDTNNRLGVGTNAPTEKITVQTSTAADGISLRDASNIISG
jgi:hypothetical protein